MDNDMVAKMKVEELKMFLKLRNLKVSGRKVELVARVFSASEMNIQPVKNAAEVEELLMREHEIKLPKYGDVKIPDPFILRSGWLTKEKGKSQWPSVMYPDIYSYLKFHLNELSSTDLSDYKNSKAYSYFVRGWLGSLFYNNVGQDSPYCIIKTDCRPSERLNDPAYKLWAILQKKDGNIKSAHSSCMVGMSGTCNHVAAMLFQIEAAVRMGLTNPACNTKSCEWLPNRKEIKAVKMKDLCLDRDDFGKRGKKNQGK